MLSNKTYDILKRISILAVPISGLICSIIKMIQTGVDPITLIMGIGSAIAEGIGIILEVSSRTYWGAEKKASAAQDGDIIVERRMLVAEEKEKEDE